VLIGVGLVWLTGFNRLDPIIALLVALNILVTGYRLVILSIRALLDISLPPEDIATVKSILDSLGSNGVRYHALRSRQAAKRKFLVVHLLVPGGWTVREAHKLAEKVETQVEQALPHANIVTHIEPVDDPAALGDASLD
jgi:divalent metal cation (Fe/Co/Zn/Cd) transporter